MDSNVSQAELVILVVFLTFAATIIYAKRASKRNRKRQDNE